MDDISAALMRDRDPVPSREWISDLQASLRDIMKTLNDPHQCENRVPNSDKIYRFHTHNVRFEWPRTSPRQSILTGGNYVFCVYFDVSLYIDDELYDTVKDLRFLQPCALHSNMCRYQLGGTIHPYEAFPGVYVINGHLKYAALRQMDLIQNTPVCYYRKDQHGYQRATVEFRAIHQGMEKRYRSTSTMTVQVTSKKSALPNRILVRWSFIPKKRFMFPLMTLLQAMGWTRSQAHTSLCEMLEGVPNATRYLRRFLLTEVEHETQEDALISIAKVYRDHDKRRPPSLDSIRNTLNNEILPNMREMDLDDRLRQVVFMASLAVKMAEEVIQPMNPESYALKQMETSTAMMGAYARMHLRTQTRSLIKQAGETMRNQVKNGKTIKVTSLFSPDRYSDAVCKVIGTGRFSDKKQSVTHPIFVADDRNHANMVSTLNRVYSWLMENEGNHFERRLMKDDEFGYTCAATTPEGDNCGHVCELATFGSVTTGSNPMPMIRHFVNIVPQNERPDTPGAARIFDQTGSWLGWVDDLDAAARTIRHLRRSGMIDMYVAVYNMYGDLYLQASEGRHCRLLVVAENLHHLDRLRDENNITERSMLAMGIIEWLTPIEEKNMRVYTTCHPDATHVEIAHYSLLGRIVASIPFANATQCPRLPASASMRRQVATSELPPCVGGGSSMTSIYGQMPISTSRAVCDMGEDNQATATNMVVAIVSRPYAQEDAQVYSKRSKDYGMCSTMQNSHYTASGNDDAKIERVTEDRCVGMSYHSYDKLDSTGVARKGARMCPSDAVIGRTVKAERGADRPRRDATVHTKHNENGIVTDVQRHGTTVHVEVKRRTTLKIGDKLTTDQGQKGTAGQESPAEDMPFTEDGLQVDIVVQPEAFPSRMTMGQLTQILYGTASALSGDRYVDEQHNILGQQPASYEEVCELLRAHGIPMCETVLYNGLTGEPMNNGETFTVGVLPFYVLKHRGDKGYSQTYGRIDDLRQPIGGRKNQGCAKIGPMETDALAAHGAMSLLTGFMRDSSDPFDVYMCKRCRRICEVNDECLDADGNQVTIEQCVRCHRTDMIRQVRIPYGTYMLMMELSAANITPYYELRDLEDTHTWETEQDRPLLCDVPRSELLEEPTRPTRKRKDAPSQGDTMVERCPKKVRTDIEDVNRMF